MDRTCMRGWERLVLRRAGMEWGEGTVTGGQMEELVVRTAG